MNDSAFKTAAYAIAEAAPRHLDQPTSPPINWQKEKDNLVVILADGRKAIGPIFDRYRSAVAFTNKQAEVPTASLPAIVVVPVPVREVVIPAPVREVVTPFPVREVVTPLPKLKPQTSSPSGKTR